jgi:hypothetical protein
MQQKEEITTDEQKIKEFEELLKDPQRVSDMILGKSEASFQEFSDLFTNGLKVKTAKCRNKKTCENYFIRTKGKEFCSKNCENIYYKKTGE